MSSGVSSLRESYWTVLKGRPCRWGIWNLSSVSSVEDSVRLEEYQILLSVKMKVGHQIAILDVFPDLVL